MNNKKVSWEVLKKKGIGKLTAEEIVDILLFNRGIKTKKEKKEFLDPIHPEKIDLELVKINKTQVEKTIKRLKEAYKKKEKVIIYGDYDADGICGTAVLWEALYELSFDVWPYLPERIAEGYGVRAESVEKLKKKYPNFKVLITVDNGIVANKEIQKINKLGIDVVVTDHHQKGKEKPPAFSIVHTTEICGAAVAWFLAREILKKFEDRKYEAEESLELAAIGTIADQIPLNGVNRSLVKWGLRLLNKTKRIGLISLIKEASLDLGNIGAYEVNFMIAPRLNAMGRIEHAIDSLRLLCTRSKARAIDLALLVGDVNRKRQKIVTDVFSHTKKSLGKDFSKKVIILADESYHEGVIGLAAGRLTEMFYRPAIVISKGKKMSKGSARSIKGFNIIQNILKTGNLIQEGGGHPMAAGFSIKTSNIKKFSKKFENISNRLLTEKILQKKLVVDMKLDLKNLSMKLVKEINKLQPFGNGNPAPFFVTEEVVVKEPRLVGRDKKHLKFKVDANGIPYDAIAFGWGGLFKKLTPKKKIGIVYSLDINEWGGREKVQLKIKDFKI